MKYTTAALKKYIYYSVFFFYFEISFDDLAWM
jgi:hypothetical protein